LRVQEEGRKGMKVLPGRERGQSGRAGIDGLLFAVVVQGSGGETERKKKKKIDAETDCRPNVRKKKKGKGA